VVAFGRSIAPVDIIKWLTLGLTSTRVAFGLDDSLALIYGVRALGVRMMAVKMVQQIGTAAPSGNGICAPCRRRTAGDGSRTDSRQHEGMLAAKPLLIAQIEFLEWAADNHLPHSSSPCGARTEGDDVRRE
jgi:hypothetical protein